MLKITNLQGRFKFLILEQLLYNSLFLDRTRQIIRYRATATLRQPHRKQYTDSTTGGGGYKSNVKIIFAEYEAVHPMVVSENNSSSEMLIILTKIEPFVFKIIFKFNYNRYVYEKGNYSFIHIIVYLSIYLQKPQIKTYQRLLTYLDLVAVSDIAAMFY